MGDSDNYCELVLCVCVCVCVCVCRRVILCVHCQNRSQLDYNAVETRRHSGRESAAAEVRARQVYEGTESRDIWVDRVKWQSKPSLLDKERKGCHISVQTGATLRWCRIR